MCYKCSIGMWYVCYLRNNLGFCQVCREITAEGLLITSWGSFAAEGGYQISPRRLFHAQTWQKAQIIPIIISLGQLCKHVLQSICKRNYWIFDHWQTFEAQHLTRSKLSLLFFIYSRMCCDSYTTSSNYILWRHVFSIDLILKLTDYYDP